MQVSAEARLWWSDGQGDAVGDWFEQLSDVEPGGCRLDGAGGAASRKDDYVLDPSQRELGIKRRNATTSRARVEVKSLVAVRGEVAPFGPVNIWTKNSSAALTLDGIPTISTRKQRRVRKFAWTGAVLSEVALDEEERVRDGSVPEAGCNVEWTRVAVEGSQETWWTLGYEAFGGLDEVEHVLKACLRESVSRTPLPAAEAAVAATYPEWLILVLNEK